MSSNWKEGAVKRRDDRNTKTPNDGGSTGAVRKDTKRWCRGKEGVEHKLECRDYAAVKGAAVGSLGSMFKGWKLLICIECGKELATHYPFGKAKKDPPDWVK